MRTRRTTALADDEPGTDVITDSKRKTPSKVRSKAGRAASGHPTDAAATGDKEKERAIRTIKRRDRDAGAFTDLHTAPPADRKRHKSEDAEQQGGGAVKPAVSRKQRRDRDLPQMEQQAPKSLSYESHSELHGQKISPQLIAKGEGRPTAMGDDAAEVPEEDDAPEEVSMAAGKAGAAQQRQQEREAAAQRRAAARARVEKRAAVAAEQKADREAQRAAKSEEAASQRQVSTRADPQENEEDDLLPPDVLEAVIKQSRQAERSMQSRAAALGKGAQPEAKPGSREGKKRPKWDPTQPRKVGPVYVQILDQLPPPTASASAKAFAQQRMFGGGRKRSAEMLQSTAKQMPGRKLLAAYGGSAMKPV